jgi:anti-sigma factor RsiW
MLPPTTHLSCRQVVELITDYLEDALEPAARADFDAHIAACDGCPIYLEQMRATIALLRSLGEADQGASHSL